MPPIHSAIRQVAITNTVAADLALPSETRQTILFSPHATQAYSVTNGDQPGLFGQGIVVMPDGGQGYR